MNRGVEVFVQELTKRLDKNKFAVSIMCHSSALTDDNTEMVRLNFFKRESFYFLERFPSVFRRILGFIDFSSSSDIEAFTLFISWLVRPKKRYDIAIPLGGRWTYRLAKWSANSVLSIGQSGPVKSWLNASTVFVALTATDLLRARLIDNRVKKVIIPNGVDFNRFKRLGRYETQYEILCVAAYVPDKRHQLLFDAVLLLPDYVRLRCVGSGGLKEQLLNHPLSKSGRVTFDSVPYSLMPSVYYTSKVFTLASKDEAFGIVFVEALAAGLNVVCHDGPRQRCVLGRFGNYCNTENVREYASVLLKALDLVVDDGQYSYVKENYSWEVVASKYEELFLDQKH